jgi:hypothetical protein
MSAAPTAAVVPLAADTQDTLRDALDFDALAVPASPLRLRSPISAGHGLDWNRTDKPDGSSALSVKRQLPLGWQAWDTKVGADFGLAPQPGTGYQPLPPVKERNSGAAWANVTLPGFGSLDARVDPAKDESKLGTTLGRSLPLGADYSVTLQNSYAVTETLGAPAAPAIAGSAPAPATQVWSTDRLVKFNIHPTGTSLLAGSNSTSLDNISRNKIGAEQKLFGPLSVTGAVTDVGGANSKSVTAGFKFKW